jgi:hypothetical protein
MSISQHPFGLLAFLSWNHDWNNYSFNDEILPKAIQQIKDLGNPTIRMDILWSDVTRGIHKYDFSRYDKLIKQLHHNGIEILGLLQYNKEYEEDGKEIWNRPPADFHEFGHFVKTTVERYKSAISVWEIWNEPNHDIYWSGPKDDLKSYSQLLKISAAAAKKEDPTCHVLNGGLTEPVLADVKNLYTHAGPSAFDILNFHIFINPSDSEAEIKFKIMVEGIQTIMEQFKDSSKPIWITEMGCPGIPLGKTMQNWFGGGPLNEKQQAAWLKKQYQLARKFPQIKKIFWAFYRDTEGIFNEATDYFGLVRSDLTPKPAYHEMKKLMRNFL